MSGKSEVRSPKSEVRSLELRVTGKESGISPQFAVGSGQLTQITRISTNRVLCHFELSP